MVYINEEEGYVQESEAKKRGLKVAKLGYGVPAAAEVRRGHPRVVCLQVRRGHPPEGRRQCVLLRLMGTSALAGDFPFFTITTQYQTWYSRHFWSRGLASRRQ